MSIRRLQLYISFSIWITNNNSRKLGVQCHVFYQGYLYNSCICQSLIFISKDSGVGVSSMITITNWIKSFSYDDVIMGAMASQITSLTIVYSTVYSGADQRKHQSSTSLAFVWGIHRGQVNSPHKWPVTRKMFPIDDVIMHIPNSILIITVSSDIPATLLGLQQ